MRWRLRVWRRRWCYWRGHPGREETVLSFCGPDILELDGTITRGSEHQVSAWRCEWHDPS